MIIRGLIKNSRREANFVSRMKPERRENYIHSSAASREWKSLVPFIEITKIHKYYRQIDYSIKLPDVNGKKNTKDCCVNYSRRDSDYLLGLEKEARNKSVKAFIAQCEARKLLPPYVHITKHDEKFRNIEYELNIS